MPTPAITAVAIFFIGMGALALIAPQRLARLVGLEAAPRRGVNEIRAVYGGFGVAMGGLLLYTAHDPGLRAGVCLTLALALFGMAAGRLISAIVERGLHPIMLAIVLVEVILGALLFGA